MKNKKPLYIGLGVLALIGVITLGILGNNGELFQGALRFNKNITKSKPIQRVTKPIFEKISNSTTVQSNASSAVKYILPLTFKITAGSSGFQVGSISTYLYTPDSNNMPQTCNYSMKHGQYSNMMSDNQSTGIKSQSGVFTYNTILSPDFAKQVATLAPGETGTLTLFCYLSPNYASGPNNTWNAEIRTITDSANKITYSLSNGTLKSINGDQVKDQSNSNNNLQLDVTSCKLLNEWYKEGELTSNISKYGTASNLPSQCARAYPEIWYGTSWDKCSIMYNWKTAYGTGTLSSKMSEAGYTAADSQYCASVTEGWY